MEAVVANLIFALDFKAEKGKGDFWKKVEARVKARQEQAVAAEKAAEKRENEPMAELEDASPRRFAEEPRNQPRKVQLRKEEHEEEPAIALPRPKVEPVGRVNKASETPMQMAN